MQDHIYSQILFYRFKEQINSNTIEINIIRMTSSIQAFYLYYMDKSIELFRKNFTSSSSHIFCIYRPQKGESSTKFCIYAILKAIYTDKI